MCMYHSTTYLGIIAKNKPVVVCDFHRLRSSSNCTQANENAEQK